MKFDLNELDFDDIAAWPASAQAFSIGFVCIILVFLGYWFDIKIQLEDLESVQKEEVSLKLAFESKQDKAANLGAYKTQMQTMEASFGALLRQLPEKTEVPGLLEDISHQGLAAGLEFKAIRLQPERNIDFYVELPIEISVIGSYHQLADFVSNVAALPRIVTLHDFVIRSANASDQSGNSLLMNVTAKTYRYMAEGDSSEKTN
jgi:type IV pilus assembly protein PilO